MTRALHPFDIDLFIALRQKSIREEIFSFGSDPQAQINRASTLADLEKKNAENFILGKFIDQDLIGMIGAIRHQNVKRQHRAWIWGMYVAPQFRGQGHSKELLQESINALRKLNGLKTVELSVTSHSPAALQLYQQFGFKEYGRQQNALHWEGVAMDEIFMDLQL